MTNQTEEEAVPGTRKHAAQLRLAQDAKDAKVHFSFRLPAAHFRHPSRECDILHQQYPIPRDLRIRFLIYDNPDAVPRSLSLTICLPESSGSSFYCPEFLSVPAPPSHTSLRNWRSRFLQLFPGSFDNRPDKRKPHSISLHFPLEHV